MKLKAAVFATLVTLMPLAIWAQEPSGQEKRNQNPPAQRPCLVIANFLPREALLYREAYDVSASDLKLSYSRDEIEKIMREGIRVVVYDQERETLGEARTGCLRQQE